MKAEKIKKEAERLWKGTKKDLDKVLDKTTKLLKKGEECIKDVSKDLSEKGKEKLEKIRLTVKREKLYYKLGKIISTLPKDKWGEDEKIDRLVEEIKNIDKERGTR